MHNLEALAVTPCSLPYDGKASVNLHMPNLRDIRKCLWENSVYGAIRDSNGFCITFHLPFVFGLFKTWAQDDSKNNCSFVSCSILGPLISDECHGRQSPAHSQRYCSLQYWGVAPRLHFQIRGSGHIPATRLQAEFPLPPAWLRSSVRPLTFHRSIVS